LAVAPVLVGELVPLVGGGGAGLEAPELLVLVDGEEQLDQYAAMGQQLLLEVADLPKGALPLGRAGQLLDPLHQHPPVPAAIEDGDAPVGRQATPEAPAPGQRLLLVAGRTDA